MTKKLAGGLKNEGRCESQDPGKGPLSVMTTYPPSRSKRLGGF